MKKYLLVILIIIGLISGLYIANSNKGTRSLETAPTVQKQEKEISINEAFILLKNRSDKDALGIFEKILIGRPDNLDALWGKAEVKRRTRQYKEAEVILNEIFKKNPGHASSLISLAYIKYKNNELDEAIQLVNRVLKTAFLDKENEALANMMMGTINIERSKKGWLFDKVMYGTQIKGYFLKARELAPDLAEVHLGLGSFYLLAPAIVGGSLEMAVKELELAVKLAPDFATANARLAQAYYKKGVKDKYNFFISRAKNLDPDNEILKELGE